MHDARPVLVTLILCACGLLWLALDWVGRPLAVRGQRLATIARLEDARTAPPGGLAAQAAWLLAHRRARLESLSGLLGLSALVGLGEGVASRSRDRLAGLRLRNWTLGLVGVALLPGLVGALLLLPQPWSVAVVGGVGAAWSALTLFLVASGRPAIP